MTARNQGTEMASVVDEAEQEREATRAAKEEQNKGIDWDRVCAYKTFKVVRIRDRQLGFCYWGIVAGVILYMVVYTFCIDGKHQLQEQGVGTVLTKIHGKAYAKLASGELKIYDPADLRHPVIEPSGAFLLTRKVAVEQKRGKCVDHDSPKKAPCDEGETEVDGFCEVETWCPSLGLNNFEDPPPEAKVDEILGLEDIRLMIMSGISFPTITDKFFVTGASEGATNQFKNIKVSELLELTQPPTSLDKKVRTNGALIGVSFFWTNCAVGDECEPIVVIKRLDSGQGFVQKRVRKYRVGDEERREALYMNGLRILVDSSGIGRKFSLVNFITQIGSAIALIRVAGIVADNFMLYSCHYSQMRRETYYKCKVQETADYSDLQDRINLIQETKSREVTARPKSGTRGGAHVALGLGAGGRGGLAAALVKKP